MSEVYISPRRYQWHRRHDETITYCLAAPFDDVCRFLAPTYVADAWGGLSDALTELGLGAVPCEWGAGHPGLMRTPQRTWEDTPIAGFGWLTSNAEALGALGIVHPPGTWWHDAWIEIDLALRSLPVPLLVAQHNHRSHVARGEHGGLLDTADGDIGLELLMDCALDEFSDWRGRSDAGPGPWGQCLGALESGDNEAFASGLADAHRVYSDSGCELVRRGLIQYLFNFLPRDI